MLDTKIDAISNDLASNLTEINTNPELLGSQNNVAVNSNIAQLEEKFDELKTEELPALQKELVEKKIYLFIRNCKL